MCYSPRSIINPTRDFNPVFDRIRFKVPCGKCGECVKFAQRDWYTRMFAEFHRCKSIGGSVAMITLTYRSEDLPIHHGYDCFDKTHIQKFLKKLRGNFKRGVWLKYKNADGSYQRNFDGTIKRKRLLGGYDVENLRYIICSEYASNPNHTQRPHYHGILYLPFKISAQSLKEYLNASWEFGFNSFSKKYGAFVQAASGTKYVAKYVTKDMLFFKNESLKNRLAIDPDFYADMKPFLPFHLQSKGFGETLVNYITPEERVNGRFHLDSSEDIEYSIPQYISRKLFYNYNKLSKTWTLSDYGKSIFQQRLNNKIQKKSEDYAKYFDWYYLDSVLSEIQKKRLVSDLHLSDCCNMKNVADLLNCFLDGRSIDLLTAYDLCYKNVPITSLDLDYPPTDITTEYGHDETGYLEMSDNILYERLSKVTNSMCETSYFKLYKHHYQYYKNHCYNSLPLFKDFDSLLHILDIIKKFQGVNKQKYFETTSITKRKTKDYHYSLIYDR